MNTDERQKRMLEEMKRYIRFLDRIQFSLSDFSSNNI